MRQREKEQRSNEINKKKILKRGKEEDKEKRKRKEMKGTSKRRKLGSCKICSAWQIFYSKIEFLNGKIPSSKTTCKVFTLKKISHCSVVCVNGDGIPINYFPKVF